MIKSVTITNYLGDAITMDLRKPNETGFLIKSIEGLGPVKANINTTEIATRDGSMYNSSRASQRNITMTIVFVDSEQRETIEGLRHKTYKYFPLKKNLTMAIETDTRTLQTIGYVESNEPEIFSSQEGTQISIICPDPYFYSYGEDASQVTTFNGITPEFEFPFSNESLTESLIEFGSINQASEGVVVYNGDSETGIRIYIHLLDEVSDIILYNLDTREMMKLYGDRIAAIVGSPLQAVDDININTIKGQKSIELVREGITYNILNSLDRNSAWFTVKKGDNLFAFTTTDPEETPNIQLSIENPILYEGV